MVAEEQLAQVEVPTDVHSVDQMWEHLNTGLRARAMRSVHEEQQKLVVELQRQAMEKGVEIAVAVVRAKAAQELNQEALKNQIIETELIPRRQELEELQSRVEAETALLNALSTIGRGII